MACPECPKCLARIARTSQDQKGLVRTWYQLVPKRPDLRKHQLAPIKIATGTDPGNPSGARSAMRGASCLQIGAENHG